MKKRKIAIQMKTQRKRRRRRMLVTILEKITMGQIQAAILTEMLLVEEVKVQTEMENQKLRARKKADLVRKKIPIQLQIKNQTPKIKRSRLLFKKNKKSKHRKTKKRKLSNLICWNSSLLI